MNLAEIARQENVKYNALQRRVNIEGESVEEAIKGLRDYEEKAKWLRVAESNDIGEGTYRRRVFRGWNRERAATEPVPESRKRAGWTGWEAASRRIRNGV